MLDVDRRPLLRTVVADHGVGRPPGADGGEDQVAVAEGVRGREGGDAGEASTDDQDRDDRAELPNDRTLPPVHRDGPGVDRERKDGRNGRNDQAHREPKDDKDRRFHDGFLLVGSLHVFVSNCTVRYDERLSVSQNQPFVKL